MESPEASSAADDVFDFVFVVAGVEVANLGFFLSGFSESSSDSELEEEEFSAFRLVPEVCGDFAGGSSSELSESLLEDSSFLAEGLAAGAGAGFLAGVSSSELSES